MGYIWQGYTGLIILPIVIHNSNLLIQIIFLKSSFKRKKKHLHSLPSHFPSIFSEETVVTFILTLTPFKSLLARWSLQRFVTTQEDGFWPCTLSTARLFELSKEDAGCPLHQLLSEVQKIPPPDRPLFVLSSLFPNVSLDGEMLCCHHWEFISMGPNHGDWRGDEPSHFCPSLEKLSGHLQPHTLIRSSLWDSGLLCHSRFPQRPRRHWQRHVCPSVDTQWMLSRQYSSDVLHDYFLSGSIWLNKAEIKSYKCAEKILINV